MYSFVLDVLSKEFNLSLAGFAALLIEQRHAIFYRVHCAIRTLLSTDATSVQRTGHGSLVLTELKLYCHDFGSPLSISIMLDLLRLAASYSLNNNVDEDNSGSTLGHGLAEIEQNDCMPTAKRSGPHPQQQSCELCFAPFSESSGGCTVHYCAVAARSGDSIAAAILLRYLDITSALQQQQQQQQQQSRTAAPADADGADCASLPDANANNSTYSCCNGGEICTFSEEDCSCDRTLL